MGVVGDDGRFLTTLTDFGIRHALLHDVSLQAPVAATMSARPVLASTSTGDEEIAELLETHRLRALPIVNDAGVVVGMRSMDEFATRPPTPVAVIMAGGRGLQPATDKTPKPLLRVGSCSILERMSAG